MTRTEVVFGMAPLGRPWGTAGCDCPPAAMGSIAMREGLTVSWVIPLDWLWCAFVVERVLPYSFRRKK